MVGRLFGITGSVLAVAVALVTPVVATSTPASAQTVIDGCTIVSNPTPTNFTDCPGAPLAGGALSGVNLSYADLSNAVFDTCTEVRLYSYNCIDTDLSHVNFTDANLSGAVIVACGNGPEGDGSCQASNLNDANLSGANLSKVGAEYVTFTGATFIGANLTFVNFGDADLEGANLTGANLTGTVFGGPGPYANSGELYADLSGANFTGTSLVPANQSVTATSQAGTTATWSTPSEVFGAAPGTCSTASGSTFPLFTTTVTCQVLDGDGNVATGTFQVNVEPTTQYFTRVLVPSDGAVLNGAPYLDAEASDGPGVTKVLFELSGGPSDLSNQVIATGTSTYVGWLAKWNTTSVPNGSYSLQSMATDADNDTDSSTPVTITVNNPPPTTTVLVPSKGATLSGSTALDASASNATSVAFVLFGGSYGYNGQLLCTATLTYYGWVCSWNTTTVPDGSYVLLSGASGGGGSTFSAGVSVTVKN